MEQPIRTISKVKLKINPHLDIAGILITMADMRTNHSREIVELLRNAYGNGVRIFDSIIPLSTQAAETSAEGRSIYLHDSAGKVFAAYAALTQEGLGMRSSASKIQLSGFSDLFQTGGETVQEVPLLELFPFKNHPFRVRDDKAMQKTAESIARNGVLSPGIVHPGKRAAMRS